MPLFKTGHQPKTHMASEFRIEEQDRLQYEISVNDLNLKEGEKEVRDAIQKWAKSQKPGEVQWIYSWNKGWKGPQ